MAEIKENKNKICQHCGGKIIIEHPENPYFRYEKCENKNCKFNKKPDYPLLPPVTRSKGTGWGFQ